MSGKLRETWLHVKNYAKSPYEPSLEEIEQNSISEKFRLLFLVLVLDLLCMIPLMGLLSFLEYLEWVNIDDHAFKDLMAYPKWAILLMVVVGAPLIEEAVFRIHLARRWNLFVGMIEVGASLNGPQVKEKMANLLREKWNQYYGLIFYLTTFLFALIHLTNFDPDAIPIWLTPVMIAPQFVTGFFLGYIRMRNGNVLWAIALHALHNAILIGPVLMLEFPEA